MNPIVFRLVGVLLFVSAAVVAILSLKRVGVLQRPSWAPVLIVAGAVLIGLSATLGKRRNG